MNIKDLRPAPDSYLLRYGGSLISLILALLCTLGIGLFITPIVSPLFLGAILFSAWWGGLRAGILVSVLSSIVIDYYFVEPENNFTLTAAEVFRFILFSTEGVLLSWLLTSRLKTMAEITDSREQLRSLSLRQQVLREDERKKIAREIHDELGQSLTGLKMEVYFLNKKVGSGNISEDAAQTSLNFDEIQKTIDMTISTVRRIATELRPPIIDDLGLVAAIEWQSKEFQRRTRISCSLETDLESIEMDSESAIAVFRIFQESLTNIIRHAEATSVKVILTKIDRNISLQVKDNGKGIKEDDVKNKKSLGLLGMKERARLINGELMIQTEELGGTVLELVFPLSESSLAGRQALDRLPDYFEHI